MAHDMIQRELYGSKEAITLTLQKEGFFKCFRFGGVAIGRSNSDIFLVNSKTLDFEPWWGIWWAVFIFMFIFIYYTLSYKNVFEFHEESAHAH